MKAEKLKELAEIVARTEGTTLTVNKSIVKDIGYENQVHLKKQAQLMRECNLKNILSNW